MHFKAPPGKPLGQPFIAAPTYLGSCTFGNACYQPPEYTKITILIYCIFFFVEKDHSLFSAMSSVGIVAETVCEIR